MTGVPMTCEKCGADSGEAELCRRCAEKFWADSFARAQAQAKVLAPMVVANTHGVGEAVLALMLLAHSFHKSMAGLPPFAFYVEAVIHSHPDDRPS